MSKISIDLIKEMVKKYPNDIVLGREVRKIFNKIQIEKQKKQTK
jgi:hypothetical protein